MANYNVDIAVAVKNLNAIKALKRELDAVQRSLDAVKNASKLDAGDESGFRKRRKQRKEEKQALLDQRRLTAELKRAEAGRRAELIKGYREQRQQELSLKRIAEQRMKGLGQYAVSIGPQPDRTAELRKKQQQVRLEVARDINFQTNFELQLAQQLLGTGKKQLNIKQQITDEQQRQIKNGQALNAQRDKALRKLDVQEKKEERMRKKRINAAVTGGAFPLLFGGGFFQAAGGAAGGAISGEMFSGATVGLQVFGSLLDRVIAGLTTNAAKLGRATTKAGADIDAIIESLGRVGDTSLDYIKSLDTTETKIFALQQANEELARLVGTEGVENFKKFGDQTRRLQNEMTAFFTSISASVAGLIANSDALEGATSMFEEFRLFDAAKRSRTGEGVTGTQKSAMQDAFSKLEKATGKERERAFKNILKLQKEIEASAFSELEIRKQQNALFIADLEQRIQMQEQEDALAEAEGKRLADQLNTGDAVTIQLQDQLKLAKAATDEETLTVEQAIRRRDILNKVHDSQKPIIKGLLDQLDAAEKLGNAEELRAN